MIALLRFWVWALNKRHGVPRLMPSEKYGGRGAPRFFPEFPLKPDFLWTGRAGELGIRVFGVELRIPKIWGGMVPPVMVS